MDIFKDHKNKDLKKFVMEGAPTEWLDSAEELMRAANILAEKSKDMRSVSSLGLKDEDGDYGLIDTPGLSNSYFLLAGFAIENLIKGIIVYNDPTVITKGKLDKKIDSHNIINLAQKIDEFSFTEKQKEVCKKIEEAIPYWGRYPIPTKQGEVAPYTKITAERVKVINSLFDELSSLLHKKIKNGWNPDVAGLSLEHVTCSRCEKRRRW